jgi:hypothetical protein
MRYKLVVFFMMLAVFLTACGAAAETTPEAQTGETGDGGSTELTETFSGDTAASGTLTVMYPSGWTTAGTADALVVTSTEAGAGVSVSVLPAIAASAMGSTPAEILESFASTAASAGGVTYGEPEEKSFGSNERAIVSANANSIDTMIAIVSVGDSYVFLTHTAPEGSMEANQALLEAIAASVTLE